MKRKDIVMVNYDAVKEELEKRNWSLRLLAEKVGVDSTTFHGHVSRVGCERMEFKLMCMILGKSEEELTYKEPVIETEETPAATSSIANILNTNALLDSINELKKENKAMHEDMVLMAKMLTEIQKNVAETKAQTVLNGDDCKAIFSKSTEINSTVNKVSGWMRAKYGAR